jgi:hypothetical protein
MCLVGSNPTLRYFCAIQGVLPDAYKIYNFIINFGWGQIRERNWTRKKMNLFLVVEFFWHLNVIHHGYYNQIMKFIKMYLCGSNSSGGRHAPVLYCTVA